MLPREDLRRNFQLHLPRHDIGAAQQRLQNEAMLALPVQAVVVSRN